MAYLYPIFLLLKDQKCLVVGGGLVAERKVASLLECGAKVKVVAPKITLQLKEWFLEGDIEYYEGIYDSSCLDDLEPGKSLVFVATNDPEVNYQVYVESKNKGLLVNVVDDPEHCSFFVPSIMRRGSLCIATSTEGKSPLLARKIREKLEKDFGPEYEEFLDILGEYRQKIIEKVPDEARRREIFKKLIDFDILHLLENKKTDLVKERIERCLSSWLD